MLLKVRRIVLFVQFFCVLEQHEVKTMNKTALISVYTKDGIEDFARDLIAMGWNIISSGGTANVLSEAGIKVTDTAKLSGRGAILGHRVVTLTPEIHGGLLADDNMLDELAELGFPYIDLVCVDFYPLMEEIAKNKATLKSVINKTDIGGPTMVRSGAKGRRIVVIDPSDRVKTIEWLKDGEPERDTFITELAAKAEGIVADYCLSSARYQSDGNIDGMVGTKIRDLKYGENAYQTPAGLYTTYTDDPLAIDKFELVEGNPGYINFTDVDRMLQTMTHIAAGFDLNTGSVPCIAVAVKHGNACGVGIASTQKEALRKMLIGDPLAIFGAYVMTNFTINEELSYFMSWYKIKNSDACRIFDGIVAPKLKKKACKFLSRTGDRCGMFVNQALWTLTKHSLGTGIVLRQVRGGFLKQPNYTYILNLSSETLEGANDLPQNIRDDIILGWAVGSTSNSNTISIVKDGALQGNGVGRQDRVGGAVSALSITHRGKHDTNGSIAYSDSFFPFPDGPEELLTNGITHIFATRGSKNDKLVLDTVKDVGGVLITLPDSEGRGFFGH